MFGSQGMRGLEGLSARVARWLEADRSLLLEKLLEAGDELFRELVDADGAIGFVFDAAHDDAVDAAGGDGEEGEKALLGDVHGEAVHRDPLGDADADRGEFAVLDPDAC